jgi:hypothetical protein
LLAIGASGCELNKVDTTLFASLTLQSIKTIKDVEEQPTATYFAQKAVPRLQTVVLAKSVGPAIRRVKAPALTNLAESN